MKPIIIVINGKARHGKDFVAELMKEYLENYGKKILIVHYGDFLKQVCKDYFGWNGVKDEAGRTLLQYIGTDIIRKKNPNFWVDVVINVIKNAEEALDYNYIFIPDSRFPNEFDRWREEGYRIKTIRVCRKNFESDLTEEQKQHISETALDNYPFNHVWIFESGRQNVLDKLIPEIHRSIINL